jgi:hypothetical protein
MSSSPGILGLSSPGILGNISLAELGHVIILEPMAVGREWDALIDEYYMSIRGMGTGQSQHLPLSWIESGEGVAPQNEINKTKQLPNTLYTSLELPLCTPQISNQVVQKANVHPGEHEWTVSNEPSFAETSRIVQKDFNECFIASFFFF